LAVEKESVEKLFQVRNKSLGGLSHLGFDHHVAITLVRVLGKEVLVVGLPHPESFQRQ
jgi:hypothetical protein